MFHLGKYYFEYNYSKRNKSYINKFDTLALEDAEEMKTTLVQNSYASIHA